MNYNALDQGFLVAFFWFIFNLIFSFSILTIGAKFIKGLFFFK